MTNTKELKSEIVRFGDTGATLAAYLGIAHPTLSKKMHNNAEFSQKEIMSIQQRYNLSPERVNEIFFN